VRKRCVRSRAIGLDCPLINHPNQAGDVTSTDQDSPPTSVLLPTVRWTDACAQVAGQLGERDELLVICDTADDPVADRRETTPDGVRIVLAGEPEGAPEGERHRTGMEVAEHDRVVWTDDDLHTRATGSQRSTPTTKRRDRRRRSRSSSGRIPARLFEPAYAIGGTGAVFAGGIVWGGAVVFERATIFRDGQDAFLADLRRTVSDDGTDRAHRRDGREPHAGRPRRRLDPGDRWNASSGSFGSCGSIFPRAAAFNVAFAVVFAALCLFAPVGVTLVTAISAAVYVRFGIRRATFLLAGPAVLVVAAVRAYARRARRTFVWGGRRYRWRSLFDVEVLTV